MSTTMPVGTNGKSTEPRAAADADGGRAQVRVRIRAARLRMTTDKKLGKPTPEWVQTLAKKPL